MSRLRWEDLVLVVSLMAYGYLSMLVFMPEA